MNKALVAVVLMAAVLTQALIAQSLDAQSILGAMEQVLAPDDYRMLVDMKTTSARSDDRLMSLEIFYKRGTGSFMELLAPARSRGIRFLEREQGLWMYNPRSGGGRAVRLSPREAFQGTVFSNSDLSDSRFTADYEPVLVGVEDYDHPDLVPLKMDYYAKSGLLFKTMRLEEVRQLAGRPRPAMMIMESRTEPGSLTMVTIIEMDLRNNPPGLFSQGNLVR